MKVTVHISFEQKDIERLDAWREERRQTRGSAIMSLLDMVTGNSAPRVTLHVGSEQTPNGVIERKVELDDY